MFSKLGKDIDRHILSFVIGGDNIKDECFDIKKNWSNIKYITNDVLFLRLTSKYWYYIINNYIKRYYKKTIIIYNNKLEYAALNGHIHILEWLKINDYYCSDKSDDAVCYALENGNISVLDWFHKNNYDFEKISPIISYIRDDISVNISGWLINIGINLVYDDDT